MLTLDGNPSPGSTFRAHAFNHPIMFPCKVQALEHIKEIIFRRLWHELKHASLSYKNEASWGNKQLKIFHNLDEWRTEFFSLNCWLYESPDVEVMNDLIVPHLGASTDATEGLG